MALSKIPYFSRGLIYLTGNKTVTLKKKLKMSIVGVCNLERDMKKINKPSLPLGFNHASFSTACLPWILHFCPDLYKKVEERSGI